MLISETLYYQNRKGPAVPVIPYHFNLFEKRERLRRVLCGTNV